MTSEKTSDNIIRLGSSEGGSFNVKKARPCARRSAWPRPLWRSARC